MESSMEDGAAQIVATLTLEQKASLCSGSGFWHTKGIKTADGSTLVPQIMVTDGPHGLRKQPDGVGDHLGIAESIPATCFPTASATASSFDRELLHEIGVALAEECLQENVAVVLGPGLNIKRSPLCGRNFEYFSEDPYVSGELAAAFVNGVQSLGVGTSMKHFAANNQERKRLVSNSVVDERALREIYLSGFETVVKTANPATVMCSYNLLNGQYASENPVLLTDILRNEWGYAGPVISDWGAVNDRVAGLAAGLDLEMPASGGFNDRLIAAAVRSGKLDEAVLDAAVERLVALALTGAANRKSGFKYDSAAHHELARRAAASSAVLLKNDAGILPIRPGTTIAVIGAMAKKPRYQGAGSSKINPTQIDCAWDEFVKAGFAATYAEGYAAGTSNAPEDMLIDEAVRIASRTDVAVVFAGLPDEYESEGYDRTSLDMPASHNALIRAVAKVNPNTVVVLHAGAPVTMPWVDQVKAILLMYLGGQAVGSATVDLLTGRVNPSGKLAETFPLHLEDTPCYGHFAGDGSSEEYRESIFVGYRYYDSANKPVAFPFGYGLSYTTFAYSDLKLAYEYAQDGLTKVSVRVTNTGDVRGAEVVQLYVSSPSSDFVYRSKQELKSFTKVTLDPGEQQTVEFDLPSRAFAYYNVIAKAWAIETGTYTIAVRSSSAAEGLSATLHMDGDDLASQLSQLSQDAQVYFNFHQGARGVADAEFEAIYQRPLPPAHRLAHEPFTPNSTMDDLAHTLTGKLLRFAVPKIMHAMIDKDDENTLAIADRAVFEMPLRALMMQSQGVLKPNGLAAILSLANGHPLAAVKHLITRRP
ncbi:MAG: glycoside hydrolase family 3 C-terminal domain-containing protein [Propionibacteriaceae bacterium]|jgi:beta-glucosidase|nr:glycoside hydrolase family 3 C-terminal domain-containing protein [Propionibacteriaceae bacterium]